VSPEKKHWAKPGVQSIQPEHFEHWDRDKLLEVRNLVRSALELVERSGDAPVAAIAIRAALDEIAGELAQ
jgi:hypothetical protein